MADHMQAEATLVKGIHTQVTVRTYADTYVVCRAKVLSNCTCLILMPNGHNSKYIQTLKM